MPLRLPNPHSPEEVRRAFAEMKAPHDVLTAGAVGEVLVGTGVGSVPAWGTELTALTKLTVDNITMDGAVISSDTGAISFSNENLTTTGTIAGVNVTSGADPGHTHSIYLKADGTVALTGNLAVDALITIDGRDISVDGAVLDAIAVISGQVKIDALATAGYIGAAAGDGVLRTSTGITYTDGGDFVTLTTNDGQIVHDNLSGYVGDQHVAHAGVTLTAGSGLSGGGTIAASRTFALDINGLAADTIVAADTIAFYDDTGAHNNKTAFSDFNAALDHGALLGRGDDDHTQYHTDARAATWLAANHETTFNHAHYDTAYGWGDHAGLYDPIGSGIAALAAHVAAYNHDNFVTAYGWGDHASGGYLKADGSVPLTADWTTGVFSLIGSDHWYLRADSKKLYFGTGDDAAISYSGSSLEIEPRLVGAGNVVVKDGANTVTISPNGTIQSSGLVYLYSADNYYFRSTAAGKSMYFDIGGTWCFRDYDDAYAVRLSIASATGNITASNGVSTLTIANGADGTTFQTSGKLYLYSSDHYYFRATAASKRMYFDVGAGWYFRDRDNAYVNRVTISAGGTVQLTTGNLNLLADNIKLQLGAASDAVIYYDGTDLIINPKVVGTGELKITGDLKVQGDVDVDTTTGALITSRMTTTQRDALTAVNGMIIYNTTTTAFNFYENGSWVTK